MKGGECIFKKVAGTRREAILNSIRQENKYLAIQELHETNNYSISLLCRVANIARCSYYKWLNREKTEREKENEVLIKEMINFYEEVNGIYGYRRITMNLNHKLNKSYNHKRIYRLMRLIRLKSVIRKKKKRYVKSKPQFVVENILNREFTASRPNEKWVTDVTEFKYGYGKKAYLSAILDLYDNSIVAYAIGHRNDNQLVFKTLDLALKANS
ncbi:IS3 family transposase [Tissierella sp. MSJ-40]|uniref:IS3 family transposase n=1 Tax=Tissierella simiarum TaxID=2841534 RepID=A0ABS6E5H8_9FIRM|nr:IS3 family transposase [Tissierella simiarum]